MSDREVRFTTNSLTRVGHAVLNEVLQPERAAPPALAPHEAINMGILATLLWMAEEQAETREALVSIAEDIKSLANVTATMKKPTSRTAKV